MARYVTAKQYDDIMATSRDELWQRMVSDAYEATNKRMVELQAQGFPLSDIVSVMFPDVVPGSIEYSNTYRDLSIRLGRLLNIPEGDVK